MNALRITWFPRVLLALVVAMACVLLFSPGSAVPSGPPGADKVVHMLLFAVLAVSSRYARIGETITVAWIFVFAALSEVAQELWVPRRDGDVLDLLADMAGVWLGLTLWRRLRRHAS